MSLELKNENILGMGGERLCYIHPEDSTKVVKVKYNNSASRNQNLIELIYYSSLLARNVDFSHLTRFYGEVETSVGRGLVFDRVENFDKSPLLNLSQVIENKILLHDEIEILLQELQYNLRKNNIIFADIGFDNIVCKKTEDGKFSLRV